MYHSRYQSLSRYGSSILTRFINRLVLRSLNVSSRCLKDDDTSKKHILENGLYFGRFTEEEYQEAARHVKSQIEGLENEIKGDFNIRENIGKVPFFPSSLKAARKDTLSNLLAETIKVSGPLSLLAYIRQCLTHPKFGYYATRDPLDPKSGDFITSPEISSMFGEMIGVWMYSIWVNQGKPNKVRFIEFGPGKGTLMYDALKSFNKLKKNDLDQENIEIVMIETSPVLRKKQWECLCGSNEYKETEKGFNISQTIWDNKILWVDTEKDISEGSDVANYVVAHEFFDALPIKSFQKTPEGWRELVVEHSPSVANTQYALPENHNETHSNKRSTEELQTEFHLTMSPKKTNSSVIPELSPRFRNLPCDSRIEICPDAEWYALKMAELINSSANLGAVLIIDYGLSEGIPDNTLRGIYKHKIVSPFFKPGEVDLSVDVDFTNLKLITEKACASYGPVPQGDWLHELGIGFRADQLIKSKPGNFEAQEKIYNAYLRLTSKDEKSMGGSYKFLAFLPFGSKSPLGFGGFF